MRTGLWVLVEGPDGGGKTTLLNALAKALATKYQLEPFVTREPGSPHSPVTSKIRDLIKAVDNEPPSPLAETMLFLADRAHHYDTVVVPALNQDKIVLQDRGYLSTIVYQCGIRSFPTTLLETMHALVMHKGPPDLVLWVDTPLNTTMERLVSRKRRTDDITTFDLEEMQRIVHDGYRRMFELYANQVIPNRPRQHMCRISGRLTPQEMCEQALEVVSLEWDDHKHWLCR